jgi:hypothetical protein
MNVLGFCWEDNCTVYSETANILGLPGKVLYNNQRYSEPRKVHVFFGLSPRTLCEGTIRYNKDALSQLSPWVLFSKLSLYEGSLGNY